MKTRYNLLIMLYLISYAINCYSQNDNIINGDYEPEAVKLPVDSLI